MDIMTQPTEIRKMQMEAVLSGVPWVYAHPLTHPPCFPPSQPIFLPYVYPINTKIRAVLLIP